MLIEGCVDVFLRETGLGSFLHIEKIIYVESGSIFSYSYKNYGLLLPLNTK